MWHARTRKGNNYSPRKATRAASVRHCMGQQEYPAGYDEAATHEDAAAYSSEAASDRVLLPPQTETVPRASCMPNRSMRADAARRHGKGKGEQAMMDGWVCVLCGRQVGLGGTARRGRRRAVSAGHPRRPPRKAKKAPGPLPSSLTFFSR
jgi:hypothetical protein